MNWFIRSYQDCFCRLAMTPIVSFFLFAYPFNLHTQEKKDTENKSTSKLEVNLEVESDAYFRGANFSGDFSAQRNQTPYRSIQPGYRSTQNLLYHTPLTGFKILFSSLTPLTGHSDRDSDGAILQSGPGKPDRFYNVYEQYVATGIVNYDPTKEKRRDEQNGLKRYMGAFVGGYYEWQSSIGIWTMGTWLYSTANTANKTVWQEFFVTFRPDLLTFINPKIAIYQNTSAIKELNGQNYISLDFSHTFRKEDFIKIVPSTHVGYVINNDTMDQRSGISNITSTLKFLFGSFYVGFTNVHRPDVTLFDTTDSNSGDGRTINPSKRNDPFNLALDREASKRIGNPEVLKSFEEEHRLQKIPNNGFYVSMGWDAIF
ncbi:MAG: hypothetical protein O9264_18055 [Leptospira sp.]|nr:hypothetical protein [Leptospira sp.]